MPALVGGGLIGLGILFVALGVQALLTLSALKRNGQFGSPERKYRG